MPRPMKHSGIDWLGDIPADWKIIKLKYVLRQPLQYGANQAGIPYDSTLPRYIRITDITTDGKLKDSGALSLSEEDAEGYILQNNDVLFARSGATVGKAFIYKKEYGKAAFAGYLIRASLSKKLLPDLFFHYTQSSAYEEWKNQIFIQSTIQNIGADRYREMPIILPPPDEQQRIASFLDGECARIDSVIEKTCASVEEYKKLKQALITRAVTKGIRPNRPMKHSGVEWLGDIPAEWKIVRFRNVLHERKEKNLPIKSTERLSLSIDLGVTLYAEKITNLDRFKDDFEQYKIAHVGDLVMNSMNMIVGATGISGYYGCVSPAYYTFYDDTEDNVTAKFCEYIFRSKTMLRVLYSLGKGIYAIVRGDDRVNTCRLKISREDLKNIKIPVPPLEEQKEIAQYLDEKTAAIDSLVAKKNRLAEELTSLKKSLIFEYVTGKKEVPT